MSYKGRGTAEGQQTIVNGDKKAESQRVIEQRKFLAQNFQKVGIHFIQKPLVSPQGAHK